jgi:hypothetical protein
MGSRLLRPVILSVLVLLLVAGSAPILAGAANPSSDARASGGYSDLVNYGTAWVPQSRNSFARFRPMGWGMEAKVKPVGVGNQWVHIPIPFMSVEEESPVLIEYVEFCAMSSNGAATMPTDFDLWSDGGRFESQAVTWPADNGRHCIGITLSPPVWQDSLGVSVSLHFANTADQITLYKAWARVRP